MVSNEGITTPVQTKDNSESKHRFIIVIIIIIIN